MPAPKDIEAEIYFLTAEEGGRSTPAFTGYRPQFYYNEHDWDASHVYPDVEVANPGETVRAYLGFLSPQEHLGKVHVGMKFLIREGARTVGKGVITKIIELEQSANREK
ncbi:MAG: elongation factor Tu [Saccharospirillum sp.]|uniref:EF-Tu C-terminal domain-related protein n=1 Tax=Saccharospirillum sp. TaxID=2033801 RepID=UPI00329A446B